MIRHFSYLFCVLLFPFAAWAGGYQLGLHGHRNTGMGLTGTSLNSDGSTVFFNPGALATLSQSYSIIVGASGVKSTTRFQKSQPSIYQASTENPVSLPFYFYASAKLSHRFSMGLAINTPYGNKISWEQGWVGRFIVRDISLHAVSVQPTISYRFTENLSAGIGFMVYNGSFSLSRSLPFQDKSGEANVKISGTTMGFGVNTGIFFTPGNSLSIGVSYRSGVTMSMNDARAIFNVPESISNFFPSPNRVATALPLPGNIDLGFAYDITPNVLMAVNFNYVFWSAYEELEFDFRSNTPAIQDVVAPRQYSNKLIARWGAEYKIDQDLLLRAGVYYDPSPVNERFFSPETPGLNNLGLTTGISVYPIENLSLDISFVYVMGMEKEANYETANFSGIYRSRAYIPGFGISYSIR